MSAPPLAPASRPESSRIATVALVAGIALLATHAYLLWSFVVDDAFITYRFARNIAQGVGPVFNPGEHVEGFSNPVYTYLLAGVYALVGSDALFPTVARFVGLVASIGSLVVLFRMPTVAGGARALAIVLAGLSTSLALWSIGGLESTQYGFVLTLAVALSLARPATARGQIGLGLVLAAIALSRPEGLLPAGVLFLGRLVDPVTRRDVRGHVRVALAAAVPVAAWYAFRVPYYGEWVPNTYYAKRMALPEALPRGRYYLTGFIRSNGGYLLYLPAFFALLDRTHRRAALVAASVVGACCFFALVSGGDWMQAHRFVAPVVPLLSLLVALGWLRLGGIVAERARGAGSWVRFVAAAVPVLLLSLSTYPAIAQQRRNPYVNVSPYFDTMGRLFGAVAPAEWTLAVHDIGAVGWYGKVRVLDLLGLVTPEIAHRRATADEIIAQRRPELLLLHYDNRTPPRERWRSVEMPDFDRTYVIPRSPVPLPGSLRVRADVAPRFEAGMLHLPPDLVRDLAVVDRYLATREPDGFPIRPRVSP